MLSWIPNAITISNLLCGCLGLIFLQSGDINTAGWMILAGVVFDFCDGFIARALKVSSDLGKQLDSLADLVSFGVLPSMIMYELLKKTTEDHHFALIALIIAAMSALRLAIFNTSTEQSNKFIGIPTTAYGVFISSLAIKFGNTKFLFLHDIMSTREDIIVIILISFLLVAKIPYLSFKFKNFKWRNNWPRFIMLIIFLFNIIMYKVEGITFSLVFYIVFGSMMQFFIKKYCE